MDAFNLVNATFRMAEMLPVVYIFLRIFFLLFMVIQGIKELFMLIYTREIVFPRNFSEFSQEKLLERFTLSDISLVSFYILLKIVFCIYLFTW